jgi:hypothetical protein
MPVDAMTPEQSADSPAPVDMNADEARAITEAIKAAVEQALTLIKDADKLVKDADKLVKDAYHRRVWLAMGYNTFDAWCLGEFGSAPLPVSREERPAMVLALRQAGLSQRAIASAIGVSKKTVDRDLDATESDDSVVLPDTITGLDNKERPAQQPKPDVPQPTPPPQPQPKPDVLQPKPRPKPKPRPEPELTEELRSALIANAIDISEKLNKITKGREPTEIIAFRISVHDAIGISRALEWAIMQLDVDSPSGW